MRLPSRLGLALSVLAIVALPGCVADDYVAVLRIDFAGAQGTISVKVPIEPEDRPTEDDHEDASSVHPGFYTAFDLLEDGKRFAIYNYTVTHYPDLDAFMVDQVNGFPTPQQQQFWALWVNGVFSEQGMTQVEVKEDDRIEFRLTPF